MQDSPGLPGPLATWFLPFAMVVMALYLLGVRRSAGPLIAAGRLTAEERDAFLRAVVFYFIGQGVIGLVVDRIWPADPSRCWWSPFVTPGDQIRFGLRILWAVMPFVWFWEGRGADLAAKMGPAFSHGMGAERWTAAKVRIGFTLFFALALIGSTVAQIARPEGMGCQ